MNKDTLYIPQAAKAKIQQLNTQALIAQEVMKHYIQGCLDTLLDNQDIVATWIFNMDDMAFHRVKEGNGEKSVA